MTKDREINQLSSKIFPHCGKICCICTGDIIFWPSRHLPGIIIPLSVHFISQIRRHTSLFLPLSFYISIGFRYYVSCLFSLTAKPNHPSPTLCFIINCWLTVLIGCDHGLVLICFFLFVYFLFICFMASIPSEVFIPPPHSTYNIPTKRSLSLCTC